VTASKPPDTSAARLLAILREAKATNMNEPALAMWCQVFGIEMTDNATTNRAFFRSAANLIVLNETVQDEAKNHIETEDVDLYMRYYGGINTVMDRFPNVIQQTMGQNIDVVDDRAEHALELIDNLLRRNQVTVPVISEEKVKALREQVEEVVLAVVEDEDLDTETKKVVIGLLRQVDDALRDSKINGVMGIAGAYDQAYGGFARRPNMLIRLSESKTYIAITSLMSAVSLAVNLAMPAAQAIEGGDSKPDPKPAISQNTTIVNQFYDAIQTSDGTHRITNAPELEAPKDHDPHGPR
jgi:hypothetical protein